MIALDFYLRHHPDTASKSEQLLIMPAYQDLLSKIFMPKSLEHMKWASDSYQHNPFYPEQLIHKTVSGIMVRSKSEVMIDMVLFMNKIPFRYECELCLGNTRIYPDFTILHPETGEQFYWEHFGMMDVPDYYHKAFSKLDLYTSNGIIPSIQLITTYETQDNPLSIETIEKIVAQYFGGL